ncbi:MAG: LysR family transcriptional regulator, partial [Deltaproteobacteria bacterium]|nr:LysR family transcriptional regulator [Deltaproteobacteria bacterium]
MFDIHRLKIFTLVAEHKSYSQAAHAIYLTQPTVSQHM